MDDVIKSLGLGLALGLVLISVLTAFPGEPFDYDSSNLSSNGDRKKPTGRETEDADAAGTEPTERATHMDTPASPHSHPVDASQATKISGCSTATASSMSNPTAAATAQKAEKERQKAKIRKLQTLLGLEKHKMDELVARAQADAISSDTSQSTSFSATSTYGGYLDFAFYFVVLALLVYVLQSEYDINVLHLITHLFPREVETVTQVLSTPIQFFQQLTSVTP